MGLVTVPSGDFRSSSEDEGFAIQDQTAGIWISVKKNLKFKVGQKVLVSGTLGQSFGKLQIVPNNLADVEALPGVKLRVATGQVGMATLDISFRSREPSRRTVSSLTCRMVTRCS
jgi:hypothetical protein